MKLALLIPFIVAASMVASACGPHYASRPACDAPMQERVFLECVRSLKNGPEVLTAAGNDAAEAIAECADAAREVACHGVERYCYSDCEAGQ